MAGPGQVRHWRTRAAAHPAGRSRGSDGRLRNEDHRQWWAAHHVATLSVGTKVLHHPIAGGLSLDWDTLTAGTDTASSSSCGAPKSAHPPTTARASSPPGRQTGTRTPQHRPGEATHRGHTAARAGKEPGSGPG
ncbi:hypothetical protein ACFVH0_16490 [Streptomyces sp. NPDC127117]|uniref:MmyB family transcriptional regulator n=1 Tax=Streptomyces sp. NPDC127117 TaxID=3345368 RepID=UPI003630A90D